MNIVGDQCTSLPSVSLRSLGSVTPSSQVEEVRSPAQGSTLSELYTAHELTALCDMGNNCGATLRCLWTMSARSGDLDLTGHRVGTSVGVVMD